MKVNHSKYEPVIFLQIILKTRMLLYFSSLLKNKDMESVNLDMDNIFEEEAGEDDFPSIGPLPDLPDREEGVDGGDQDEGMYYYLTSVKPLPALPDKEEGVIEGDQDEGMY
jgi:hypothetical protein